MENGREGKFRYGRCQNGMEDFKSGVEDNLPYFHTNSILDFIYGIYRKIYNLSVPYIMITKNMWKHL